MKKLLTKSVFYICIIMISLELLIRVFHLGRDTPNRFIDAYGVEKWVPDQKGISVTGNRRQNFSEYRINNAGYNSYREFSPSKNKTEIALVGDSFIEGFHQDYYNSIGKKIEHTISEIEVYEYGYAGYDFADQLHLVYAYKKQFEAIDHIIFTIKFSNDLDRSEYKVITDRIALESPTNKLLKKSKLIVYCKSIGVLDPIKQLINKLLFVLRPKPVILELNSEEILKAKKIKEIWYLENFKKLVSLYGFDKKKCTLLLDSSITSPLFLEYLKTHGYHYIDFFSSFQSSTKSKTLIYDKHWNNHGRTIIAKTITDYLKPKLNNDK